MCLVGFVVAMTVMVISFGIVLFLLWLRSVNILSFMILWSWTSPRGLGVSCGMVGYLWSQGVDGGSPWAEDPDEGAGNLLECAFGAYTSGLLVDWQLPVGFDAEGAAERVAAEPDVWTEGALFRIRSLVLRRRDRVFFVFLVNFGPIVGSAILMMSWEGTGTFGLAVVTVLFLVRYRLFGVLSSEGAFLPLQAVDGIHLGVDNVGVVRHVGRLLDGSVGFRPPELVTDGDLILLIGGMLRLRGSDTVRVTKVEGDADEDMVG